MLVPQTGRLRGAGSPFLGPLVCCVMRGPPVLEMTPLQGPLRQEAGEHSLGPTRPATQGDDPGEAEQAR